MNAADFVHLVLLPPDSISDADLQKASAILGKHAFETKLLFTGKTPRIIAHYASDELAEPPLLSLKALGLKVIAVRQERVPKSSTCLKAYAAQFEGDAIIFLDRQGQRVIMTSSETFLIIAGVLETGENIVVTNTGTKLNLPVTLLTGIPVNRRVTETTSHTSVHKERFLRLYGNTSSECKVEIRQNDFDYSCLGPALTFSTSANFDLLVARIRKTLTGAQFDDSLTTYFRVDLPVNDPWEKVDMVCRWIYLFKLESLNSGRSG